jgi:hypothetical protein
VRLDDVTVVGMVDDVLIRFLLGAAASKLARVFFPQIGGDVFRFPYFFAVANIASGAKQSSHCIS